MRRAWSVDNVANARFKGLEFEGKWRNVIGRPELAHNWIIWGQSGSGKTTLIMQLVKYISGFETVLFNSLEEGLSLSLHNTYRKVGLTTKDKVLLVSENMNDVNTRLLRKKSPKILLIDSEKYTRFKWNDYMEFSHRFPNIIKIWIAHADGKEPKSPLAKDIRYDAFVKIYTEGFRAFVTSRFNDGGETYMDIWPEKAAEYYAEKTT